MLALPFLFALVLGMSTPDPTAHIQDKVCVEKARETAQAKSFGKYELENLVFFDEIKNCK